MVREAFDQVTRADIKGPPLRRTSQVRGGNVAVKLECGGTKHAQLRYEFELYRYINGQRRRSSDSVSPPVRWKDHSVRTACVCAFMLVAGYVLALY